MATDELNVYIARVEQQLRVLKAIQRRRKRGEVGSLFTGVKAKPRRKPGAKPKPIDPHCWWYPSDTVPPPSTPGLMETPLGRGGTADTPRVVIIPPVPPSSTPTTADTDLPIHVIKKPKAIAPLKRCTFCYATETPMWRTGPEGPATLCNACGVKWRRSGARGSAPVPRVGRTNGSGGGGGGSTGRPPGRPPGSRTTRPSSPIPQGFLQLPNPALEEDVVLLRTLVDQPLPPGLGLESDPIFAELCTREGTPHSPPLTPLAGEESDFFPDDPSHTSPPARSVSSSPMPMALAFSTAEYVSKLKRDFGIEVSAENERDISRSSARTLRANPKATSRILPSSSSDTSCFLFPPSLLKKRARSTTKKDSTKLPSASEWEMSAEDLVGKGFPRERKLGGSKRDMNDYICAKCEGEGDLLLCDGPCLRSFHMECLGLVDLPMGTSWYCKDCREGRHECWKCKRYGTDGVDLRRCSLNSCGKFYHVECIEQIPLARIEGGRFYCPLHACRACGGSGRNMLSVRCSRCPTAYHVKCLPPGVRMLGEKRIICPDHDAEPLREKPESVRVKEEERRRISEEARQEAKRRAERDRALAFVRIPYPPASAPIPLPTFSHPREGEEEEEGEGEEEEEGDDEDDEDEEEEEEEGEEEEEEEEEEEDNNNNGEARKPMEEAFKLLVAATAIEERGDGEMVSM